MTARWNRRMQGSGLPHLTLTFDVPGICQLWWLQVVLWGSVLLAGGLSFWWWSASEQGLATASQIEEATVRVVSANRQFAGEMSRQGLSLTPTRVAQVKQEIKFSKMLVSRRGVSWTLLLTDLEQTVPRTVSLLSVEMNHADSIITIEGTSESLQDINMLVTKLEAHSSFHAVRLSNHRVEVAQRDVPRISAEPGSDPPAVGESKRRRMVFRLTATYQQSL